MAERKLTVWYDPEGDYLISLSPARHSSWRGKTLADAMADTLATKQDLSEVRSEVSELQVRMDAGFAAAKETVREPELRVDARLGEHAAIVRGELAGLEQ